MSCIQLAKLKSWSVCFFVSSLFVCFFVLFCFVPFCFVLFLFFLKKKGQWRHQRGHGGVWPSPSWRVCPTWPLTRRKLAKIGHFFKFYFYPLRNTICPLHPHTNIWCSHWKTDYVHIAKSSYRTGLFEKRDNNDNYFKTGFKYIKIWWDAQAERPCKTLQLPLRIKQRSCILDYMFKEPLLSNSAWPVLGFESLHVCKAAQ